MAVQLWKKYTFPTQSFIKEVDGSLAVVTLLRWYILTIIILIITALLFMVTW